MGFVKVYDEDFNATQCHVSWVGWIREPVDKHWVRSKNCAHKGQPEGQYQLGRKRDMPGCWVRVEMHACIETNIFMNISLRGQCVCVCVNNVQQTDLWQKP